MNFNLDITNFKLVDEPQIIHKNCVRLLKYQTLNLNRAIAILELEEVPEDIEGFILQLRKKIAFKVNFFPLLWGVGIQMVIISPGISSKDINPNSLLAKVDNQWAIIQSVFLVDPITRELIEGRSWGQTISRKFQDEIASKLKEVLAQKCL